MVDLWVVRELSPFDKSCCQRSWKLGVSQKMIVSSSLISWFRMLSSERISKAVAPVVKFMIDGARNEELVVL